MGDIEADTDGLAVFAQQCVVEADAVAASGGELSPGARFQATAAAVTAGHDGVAAARRALVERMAATSERVTAAARTYDATEQSSSDSLRRSAISVSNRAPHSDPDPRLGHRPPD